MQIQVWDDSGTRISELADYCNTTVANIVDCMIEMLDDTNDYRQGTWEDEIKRMEGVK